MASPPPTAELRERLLTALRNLLDERRFDSVSVADVITAASVSRASFYFYFPGKSAVLAELVRRAVAQGREIGEAWTGTRDDPREALRAGVTRGAHLWRDNAGVLRAIVESWGSDDELRRLWLEQMDTFTEVTVARIQADPVARHRLDGSSIRAVAASLTWLSERLYYLAASGVAPFTNEALLVDTLTNVWVSTLYGDAVT